MVIVYENKVDESHLPKSIQDTEWARELRGGYSWQYIILAENEKFHEQASEFAHYLDDLNFEREYKDTEGRTFFVTYW